MVRLLALLLIVASSAVADAQSATTQIAEDRFAGVPFAFQIVVQGMSAASPPPPPDIQIKGAQVKARTPRTSTSISVINGRRSQSMTISYVYEITAPKGRYTIPSVVVGGNNSVKTSPVTFQVREVPQSGDIKVRLDLPNKKFWVGEQFETDIVVSIRRNREVESLSLDLPIANSDYAQVKSKPVGQISRSTIQIDANGLQLYGEQSGGRSGWINIKFPVVVTVLKSGTHKVEPVTVTASIQTGTRRDGFFRVPVFSPAFQRDKSRTLDVKALPSAGKPKSFVGAIGSSYSIEVRADRTVVKVGEPIAIEMLVRGDGPLPTIEAPALKDINLPSDSFEIIDNSGLGEPLANGAGKSFRATVQVLKSSVRELPAIKYAFFDIATGNYGEVKSSPIALSVAGASIVGSQQVVDLANRTPSVESELRLEGADLTLSTSAFGRATQPEDMVIWIGLLYAVPLLLLVGIVGRRYLRSKSQEDSAFRAASDELKQYLDDAQRKPAREVASQIVSALTSMAKKRGSLSLVGDVVKQVETQAYAPEGKDKPLDSALVKKVESLAQQLRKTSASSASVAKAVAMVLLLLPASVGAQPSLESARTRYRQAMAEEDASQRTAAFRRVAQELEALTKKHPGHPALLVDAGNAWLGARDLGRANLYFLRALRLDPDNPRASANTAWLNSQLPNWAQREKEDGQSLIFWHDRLSVVSKHVLAGVFFGVGVFLVIVWIVRGRSAPLLAGISLSAMAWLALLISALLPATTPRRAVVVAPARVLQADIERAPAVWDEELPAGSVVDVQEMRNFWVKVKLKRIVGWMPRASIELVAPQP